MTILSQPAEALPGAAPSILENARNRGITRLVHFTPLNNLMGIVELGAVFSRDQVARLARERQDQYLLHYVAFNDRLRLDQRTGYVNLSIQHPNTALLRRFREGCAWCDVWCVLLVSIECLTLPGVLFCTGNAAATHVRRTGTGLDSEGFEALFSSRVLSASRSGTRVFDRKNLAPCWTTDPQAEALVPRQIPLARVEGFAFESEASRQRARAALRLLAPETPLPAFVTAPELFQERRLNHG